MNALVGIRSNAAGQLSPTQDQRAEVAQKLAQTAAARAPGAVGAVNEVTPSNSTTAATTTATRDPSSELGKEAFLQLLVLQLQNQDPLAPVDNAEMLSQLAQFSALENLQNLNDSFEVLSGNVDQLNFISASQLLGKTVQGVDLTGQIRTGVVESVHLDGSVVVLNVDGNLMSMAGILQIGTVEPDASGEDTSADPTET